MLLHVVVDNCGNMTSSRAVSMFAMVIKQVSWQQRGDMQGTGRNINAYGIESVWHVHTYKFFVCYLRIAFIAGFYNIKIWR